jgi:hypothetical protein
MKLPMSRTGVVSDFMYTNVSAPWFAAALDLQAQDQASKDERASGMTR